MDISAYKKDFPILSRSINGKPIVYLDSSASSLKPAAVIAAMEEYYSRYGVNIFRGLYTLSEEATAKYEEARQTIAEFIGATNAKEVVFVRNATEAINLVAYAWARQNIKPGEHILSTAMEHHANIVPWQELAKDTKWQVEFAPFDSEGKIDSDAFVKKVTEKTKLVTFTYVSNVFGTINPVADIVKRVKEKNPACRVLIDAAQAVPHLSIDIKTLVCDFFVFSGHKMLGPTGIGVLWGPYDVLSSLRPFQMGGDMIAKVTLEETTYKEPPYRFEAGTPHIAGAIGLAAACRYLTAIGMDAIRQHEIELTEYGLSQLQSIPGLTLYGPKTAQERGGVLAFSIPNLHPHDIAQILNEDNICVRSGHHCAMPLHQALGIPASTRASLYLYNTREDIDKLVAGLNNAAKQLSRI